MFPVQKHYISGHNRPGKKLEAVKSIIIHWTANTSKGANAMANRNYFNSKHLDKNGNIIYASAHYLVDSTSIVQAVPDDEVAYHVGAKAARYTAIARNLMGSGTSPNFYTIGIEMCVNQDGDWSTTYAQTVALTRYLAARYNIGRSMVLRHYDITGKLCPQMMIEPQPWNAFLDAVFGPVTPIESYNQTFVVNVASLNVRSGPGTEHPRVGMALAMGMKVVALSKVAKWIEIENGRFVHSDYLKEQV